MVDGLVIDRLYPGDESELIAAAQATFPAPDGEPMARLLGIGKEDYVSYTELVVAKALRDGLTLVARSFDGRIAGFLISEDFATAPPYGSMPVSKKFGPLIGILDALDDEYRAAKMPRLGDVFHLYMLGVRSEFSGQGLARRLVKAGLALAKERGFQHAVVETTGESSRSLCRKLGFHEFREIAYPAFEYAGDRPFAAMTAARACVLQERSVAEPVPQ